MSQPQATMDLQKTITKNLVIGGTAGIIGSLSTYPLDLIKTRLQNQKNSPTPQYKNALDCMKQIMLRNGFFGLYSGLGSQLLGITPEKAIKLTVNDTVRSFFLQEDGSVSIIGGVIAGSLAGTTQVVATNPYELVKVRLQTQNQLADQGFKPKGMFGVIREIGIRGMFTGASATLLRDVPFSAIYFSMFGVLNHFLKDESGKVSPLENFGAGVFAGSIAAATVTPADVIKTRLQVKSEKKVYDGIADCARKIIQNEGVRALFKGVGPRVMIISPLFGITLSVYEALKDFFY